MQKDEIRDRLVELISQAQDCGCDVTDVVDMIYVENKAVADHLLANGVTVQEWIPDAERSPEVDPETGYVEVAVFTKDRKIKTAIWDGENYYVEAHTIDDLDVVVAYWTYLPPRPKEVE